MNQPQTYDEQDGDGGVAEKDVSGGFDRAVSLQHEVACEPCSGRSDQATKSISSID